MASAVSSAVEFVPVRRGGSPSVFVVLNRAWLPRYFDRVVMRITCGMHSVKLAYSNVQVMLHHVKDSTRLEFLQVWLAFRLRPLTTSSNQIHGDMCNDTSHNYAQSEARQNSLPRLMFLNTLPRAGPIILRNSEMRPV